MNKAIVILLAACGLSAFVTNPAAAFGTRYPFCLQSDEWPGLSNCTFTSYEQCQASASARAATCLANPYFAGGRESPPTSAYQPLPGRTLPPAPSYSRY
jgi:hypothetical protein